MLGRILLLFMVVALLGCDAHMQKGLQLYKERDYEDDSWQPRESDFFTDVDDVGAVFPKDVGIEDKDQALEGPILSELQKISVKEGNEQLLIRFVGNGTLGRYGIKRKDNRILIKLFGTTHLLPNDKLGSYKTWLQGIKLKTKQNTTQISISFLKDFDFEFKVEKQLDGFIVAVKRM